MKLAVDCRMLGTGGIGTYIAELIPLFLEKYTCLLIGRGEDIAAYADNPHAELCPCAVKAFSLRELTAFPSTITGRINACDVYYTPYCNIPSGIKVPVFSTIHDVVQQEPERRRHGFGFEWVVHGDRRWRQRHDVARRR